MGVNHLRQLKAHWELGVPLEASSAAPPPPATPPPPVDLADIHGQPYAKRALEVAAAGAHHLLLVGPPGTGKTLLARALPGILPPLNRRESVEVTSIASCVGMLPAGANNNAYAGAAPLAAVSRFMCCDPEARAMVILVQLRN